ncbi:cytochrome P450 736A117-like [Rutidosis leptorrhynchoides]|uniref:cytochrome P450 736A117-like n=1 Tax=Rutidosis leptorrhynchoides TaxID=125765 RepID=UPI003A99A9B8
MFHEFSSSSSSFLLLPSIFILLVVSILSIWYFSPSKSLKNLPPSPTKLPIIGNFHQLGATPHRSLQVLAQKHGPLMLLHFGRVPVLVVSSADASREIMKTHDLIFSNRPESSVRNILTYNGKDIGFSNYGEHWRQTKSMVVFQLLSQKRVESFRRIREKETDLLVEKIRDISCSSSPVINMNELVLSMSNSMISMSALGKKHKVAKFRDSFASFVDLAGAFCIGDYIPWLSWVDRLKGYDVRAIKVAAEIDSFLENVIKEHLDVEKQKSDEEKDFVDILLEIQNKKDAKYALDRDTIKAIILDVFVGATDTTYITLVWQLSELLRNPRAMKKLQEEVRRHVVKGKSKVTEDDLKHMIYLKAVIKETLRMHPPAPLLFPRVSTQDAKVMGYDIAAGTQVLINEWVIGRDPCSWDNPDEFMPERFLDSSIDYKGHHFQFTPFGSGRRICPGIKFAMAINELVLANLVHKFDFMLPDGQKGEDLDMNEINGLALLKKLPLLVLATSKFD